MNKTGYFFWGGILIIVGGLFLIESLGILDINIGRIFWPLVLILLGAWVLVGYFSGGPSVEAEEASIPLEGSRSAVIRLNHGAGRLTVRTGAKPMDLVSGTFGGGLSTSMHRDADRVDLRLKVQHGVFPFMFFPWYWGPHHFLDWDLRLTDEIPLELRLNTGASDTRLDLTDLQVTNLRLETGASATEINLPDGVAQTTVLLKAGAASVKVNVPENVAARVYVSGGLMSAGVDRNRFPKTGRYYQSPDYESAPNKVEMRVDVGVGSVTVR